MEIQQVTRTVFIGHEGQEFLTEQEAANSIIKASRETARDELVDMILEAGGPYYEFDYRAAAEGLIDNAEKVIALLRKAAWLGEP